MNGGKPGAVKSSNGMNSTVADGLCRHVRVNASSETIRPIADIPTVIHVCAVNPRNTVRVKSTSIYSSFLRCLKGLVCAITSLSRRRKDTTFKQGSMQ